MYIKAEVTHVSQNFDMNIASILVSLSIPKILQYQTNRATVSQISYIARPQNEMNHQENMTSKEKEYEEENRL